MHNPPNTALITRTTAFIATERRARSIASTSPRFAHQRVERDAHESDQAEIGYFVVARSRRRREDGPRAPRADADRHRSEEAAASSTSLAENVEEFDLKYLDPLTGQWVDTWDTTQVTGQPERLPLEVKLTLVLKGVPAAPSCTFATKIMMPMQQPLTLRDPAMSAARADRGRRAPSASPGRAERERAEAREAAGIALVMVLGAIAVLTVMLAEFQDDTSAELAERDGRSRQRAGRVHGAERGEPLAPPHRDRADDPPGDRAALHDDEAGTPPQLPVWEFSDRLLGAFNDSEASQGLRRHHRRRHVAGQEPGAARAGASSSSSSTRTRRSTRTSARRTTSRTSAWRKELMGLMAPPSLQSALRAAGRARATSTTDSRCAPRIIDWADVDEQRSSPATSRTDAAPSGQAQGGRVLPAAPEAVPPQERAVRLARRAAHGARRDRRLLGDVRRSRSDEPEEARASRCGGRARST